MLLDNFYTILSSEQPDETSGTVLLELNPDHAIYQGHFPAHPVVPGVCLLQLIKESVENATKRCNIRKYPPASFFRLSTPQILPGYH